MSEEQERTEPAPEAQTAPAGPRFCGRCGSPVGPSATCVACARVAPVPEPETGAGSVKGAIALYFVLLGSFLGLLLSDSIVEAQLIVGAVDAVIVVAWCVAARRDVAPGLRMPEVRWLLIAPAIAVATWALATMAVGLMARLLGVQELVYSEQFLVAGYGWATVVLAVVAQPAVIEELAFRGVVLGSLRRVLSNGEAIAVSALMFALLHLSVASLPHLVVLGVALAVLRIRSGSLLPPMIVHATHNALCLVEEALRAG